MYDFLDLTLLNYLSSCLPQANFSTFHSIFNKEKTSAETETRLNIISYLWDDVHIMSLDEKTDNAYGVIKVLQGINATKALAHIFGKKGLHIGSCYVPKENII